MKTRNLSCVVVAFVCLGCPPRVPDNGSLIALNPRPRPGAQSVDPNSDLSWSRDVKASRHDVYFGTSLQNVQNATRSRPLGVLVAQDHREDTYEPGTMNFETTYYWRIDGVNDAEPNGLSRGNVWNFKTRPPSGCKEATAALYPIPPQYGDPIAGSSGTVKYCLESSGTFEATVTINGLERSHVYALTLNGKVGKPGNEELIRAGYMNQQGEGVVDRIITPTDSKGCWTGKFPGVALDPNENKYQVKFFVKNREKNGWPIVLHNDDLFFKVTE